MVALRPAMDFCESLARALVESGRAQGSSFDALWKQAVKAVAKDSGDEAKAIHAAFKENPALYKKCFKSHLQKAQEMQQKKEKAAQRRGGKKAAAGGAKGVGAPSVVAQFVLGMPVQLPADFQLADSVHAAEEVIANLCRHKGRRALQLLHEAFVLLESNYTALARPDATLRSMATYLQLHRRDHTAMVNVRRVLALYMCILHHVQGNTTLHPSAGIVWTLEDSIVACAYLLRYWHREPSDTTRRMCMSALNELVQKLRAAGHGSGGSSSDPTSGKSVAVYSVVAAAAIVASLQKQGTHRLADTRLEGELTRTLRSWGQIVWPQVYERVVEVLLRSLDFGDLDAKEELKAVERVRLDDVVRYLSASAEDAAAVGEVLIHLTAEHQRHEGDDDDDDDGDDDNEDEEDEGSGDEEEEDAENNGEEGGEEQAGEGGDGDGVHIDELLEEDYSEPEPKKDDDLLSFVVDTAAAAKMDELAAMTEEVLSPPQTRSKRKAKAAAASAATKKQQQPAEAEDEQKEEAPPTTRKRTRRSTRS